jgi:hypothetical protein
MFKLSTSDRLGYWKQFRTEIDSMTLHEAIIATNELWQSCPFIPYYLEPDKPEEWPDPWQLITENYYCDIAKVLGIVYTLHLSKHSTLLTPEIRIYLDTKSRYSYHIAWLNEGKYIVNLSEDVIVNKEQIENQNLKLKHCYTPVELKLEQY